jgi:hypothetical protein
MSYTKQNRKTIHSQLVAAKKHLWTGVGKKYLTEYICIAVIKGLVASRSDLNWSITTDMIESRLRERTGKYIDLRTVRDWLIEYAKIPVADITDESLQTYRHEWLDQLISEFSE